MIQSQYISTLVKIYARLKDSQAKWVVTGSLGMALQGMDVEVHDIDIQTDQQGAYEIESKFPEHIVVPVHYTESERMRSHLGELKIDDIKVEIMGDIQKLVDEQKWEEPVELEHYRGWVTIEGMQIPVLSLEYEYQAYLKMGRVEKAALLRAWLQKQAFWQKYLSSLSNADEVAQRFYEAFRIGDSAESADKGAELILKGIKSATSTLLWEYQVAHKLPPQVGSLSMVENGKGEPVCIVETTEVTIKRFSDVDARFAYDYGEWDRTLDTWRRQCWEYYSNLCLHLGREPIKGMRLVCERFKVVYPCCSKD